MFYVLDKTENNTACLISDNGDVVFVNVFDLPPNPKEGDVFLYKKNYKQYVFCKEETSERKARVIRKLLGLSDKV